MADELTFRSAGPADLPMVLRAERAYMESVEPAGLSRWVAAIADNLELWVANLERTTVAQSAAVPVGFVMWTRSDDAALVITVQVLPGHRRRGIGSALLRAVAEQAVVAGLAYVRLGVHAANPARSIYVGAGYTQTGTDGDYLLHQFALDRPGGGGVVERAGDE